MQSGFLVWSMFRCLHGGNVQPHAHALNLSTSHTYTLSLHSPAYFHAHNSTIMQTSTHKKAPRTLMLAYALNARSSSSLVLPAAMRRAASSSGSPDIVLRGWVGCSRVSGGQSGMCVSTNIVGDSDRLAATQGPSEHQRRTKRLLPLCCYSPHALAWQRDQPPWCLPHRPPQNTPPPSTHLRSPPKTLCTSRRCRSTGSSPLAPGEPPNGVK